MSVGQEPADHPLDPQRLLDAYAALFGPGANERTFRANVRRLFNSWAQLLKDTGLRAPKRGLEDERQAVLLAMRRYNDWRQDVLALPEGSVSDESIAKYGQWRAVYGRARERIKAKTRVRAPAPEDIRGVARPAPWTRWGIWALAGVGVFALASSSRSRS